jgi:hypothetical protein
VCAAHSIGYTNVRAIALQVAVACKGNGADASGMVAPMCTLFWTNGIDAAPCMKKGGCIT